MLYGVKKYTYIYIILFQIMFLIFFNSRPKLHQQYLPQNEFPRTTLQPFSNKQPTKNSLHHRRKLTCLEKVTRAFSGSPETVARKVYKAIHRLLPNQWVSQGILQQSSETKNTTRVNFPWVETILDITKYQPAKWCNGVAALKKMGRPSRLLFSG